MPIITFGMNHKTAPIAIREQMAFSADALPEALRELMSRPAVNEAVMLSTCNRTEIYAPDGSIDAIYDWLNTRFHDARLDRFAYVHQGKEAIQHIMRVASGLDSMVLGEHQILGQLKQAYTVAAETGSVGTRFKHLFPAVFAASKLVRHQTNIGAHPITLAYAITQLSKRIFSKLKDCQLLLVGAGEMIELVATHFKENGVKNIIIANRTIEKGEHIAHSVLGKSIRIGDIPVYLKEADIIVTATASQLPIIGKGLLETTLKQKKRRPLLIADLAVPRDVEPEVSALEDVYLYNIDDLETIINENLKNREEAAHHAEMLIELEAVHYMQQLRVLSASDMIHDYRDRLDAIREEALAKALQKLKNGQPPEAVLTHLSHQLVNKIMHKPTVALRDAARDEDIALLSSAKHFLDV